MKTAHILAILFSCTALCACGSKSPADTPSPTDLAIMEVCAAADSIEKENKQESEKKQPAIEAKKFSSAAEAIDYMKNSGHWDEYSKGILPGIAHESLEYVGKLLGNPFPYFIIADKESMHVILYNKYGVKQKAYLMACSRHYGTKHKFRDNRTPEGFFTAEGVYDSRDWLYTNDDGYTSPAKGVYGPRFIRLKTPVTGSVGIHGTNAPGSPGRRCSHGCMRLNNAHIQDLVKYVQKGMPIIVNPSRKDDAVNREEGYHVTMLSLGKITSSEEVSVETETKKEVKPDTTDTVTAGKTEPEKTVPQTEVPEHPAAPAEPAPKSETKPEPAPEPAAPAAAE